MSFRWALFLGWAVLLSVMAVGADKPLKIQVRPTVLLAGGTVRVTCKVARSPNNRWLELGIVEVRKSGRQLDGEQAYITHDLLVEHVPCGADKAYCLLVTSDGGQSIETLPIVVSGCN